MTTTLREPQKTPGKAFRLLAGFLIPIAGLCAGCGRRSAVALEVGPVQITEVQARVYLEEAAAEGSETGAALDTLADRERAILAFAADGGSPQNAPSGPSSEDSLLVEGLLRESYPEEFSIPEGVLRSQFSDSTERRRVRHILCESQEAAALALGLLRSGKPFEDVCKSFSKDPKTSQTGGDLGWISREGLDPNFSEAAFAMSPGRLGGPVKSAFGFHLLEVMEIKRPTDEEYSAGRGKFLASRLKAKRVSLEKRLDETLQERYPATTDENPIDTDPNDLVERPGDSKAVVATLRRAGDVTLADLKAYMRQFFHGETTSHALGARVKKMFLGDLLRQKRLVAEAKRLGLHKGELFQARVWNARHDILAKEAEARAAEEHVPAEDALRAFYEEEKGEMAPRESAIAMILHNDGHVVSLLAERLRKTPETFAREAKALSLDTETGSRGGEIGWVAEASIAKLVGAEAAAAIVKLKPGEVFGPVNGPLGFILVKVLDSRTGEAPPFESVRGSLLASYRTKRREAILEAWRQSLRERFPARISPEFLRTVDK